MRSVTAALTAAAIAAACPASAQDAAPATITDIRAQLYYERTGTFSEDVISEAGFVFWNTIIGEGEAADASSFTLVTAEVAGRNVPFGEVSVELVARTADGEELGAASALVTIYDAATTFYAPLLLADTGCRPVAITARLVGEGVDPTPVSETIPFRCGE